MHALAKVSSLLVVLLSQQLALGAPTVTVTGRTTLRLTRVARTPARAVEIRGDLRDASLSTGVAGARVTLRVWVARAGAERPSRRRRRLRRSVRTDEHGVFSLQVPLPKGVYRVVARFAGNRLFAPAEVDARELDVSKLALALAIDAPSDLDAQKRVQRIAVSATVDGQPVAVPLSLWLGKRSLGSARSARDGGAQKTGGRAIFEVPTAALGRPGPLTLEARFAGSDEINATRVRRELVLVEPVNVTLQANAKEVDADGDIRLRGVVRARSGAIEGAAVSVHGMGRHLAAVRTDNEGRFSIELKASAFAPGPLDLVAHFTPAVMWRRRSRSTPVRLVVKPVNPIPARAYLIPAGATLLAVIALLGVRYRDRLFPRGAAAQPQPGAPPAAEAASDGEPPPPLASGLEASSTKRKLRASDFGLSGIVWDAADEVPIAGASLTISQAGDGDVAVAQLQSDTSGRFEHEALASGAYRVDVRKAGFVPERFEAEMPHRGQLRGVRVRMVPIRVRVLEIYREVALVLLPESKLWARWTPRELLRHVRRHESHDKSSALARLSTVFEEVYWGPDVPPLERLDEARQLSREVRGAA
ncbi:MAG: carboxypeptidase regulatory-like domain-containing protein [Myxococcales bacterium]|nr:carboxypeptidase regulatory-like domain-containing protein [Myxococcales bacterium]